MAPPPPPGRPGIAWTGLALGLVCVAVSVAALVQTGGWLHAVSAAGFALLAFAWGKLSFVLNVPADRPGRYDTALSMIGLALVIVSFIGRWAL